LLAACNPVVAHLKDGSVDDAAPDAPTHGMVRIQIYDPAGTGAVVTGVPVVFVEADDTQVGHPVTDANGYVSADVHAGASATLVITMGNTTQLETLLGLKPGDDIILGPRRDPSSDAGNFTVSFATYPGATSYIVYGPCGSTSTGSSPVTLSMYNNCKQDMMNLLVVAYDSSGPIAALSKTGVTFQAGGSTAVTGSYQFVQQMNASYTNIPSNISNIDVSRSVPDQYGFNDEKNATPMNGTFSTTLFAPQGPSALITTNVNHMTNNGRQTVQEKIAGNALTHGMDVGATLLPWLGAPTFDVATHKLTVPVDNTGTSGDAPDVFFAETSYSRGVDPNIQRFDWLVIGATPSDVTMPTLPMEVGDVMPKSTDMGSSGVAALAESDALTGYDVIRQDVFTLITSVTDPIHPSATKTRMSINFGSLGVR
jgi:hypothetical protein